MARCLSFVYMKLGWLSDSWSNLMAHRHRLLLLAHNCVCQLTFVWLWRLIFIGYGSTIIIHFEASHKWGCLPEDRNAIRWLIWLCHLLLIITIVSISRNRKAMISAANSLIFIDFSNTAQLSFIDLLFCQLRWLTMLTLLNCNSLLIWLDWDLGPSSFSIQAACFCFLLFWLWLSYFEGCFLTYFSLLM